MGGAQSNQHETNAFSVIRCVPILNLVYEPIRSAVYAGMGDQETARSTLTETARSVIPGASLIQKRVFEPLSQLIIHLNPGDLIEFNRGSYSHYALYLGFDQVMNIQAEDKNDDKTIIKRTTVDQICNGSLIRISNHDDVAMRHFGLKPKPFTEILEEATRYENRTVPYDFMFRNCEYYSTYWRFGKGFSTQAADVFSTPGGYIAESVFAIAGTAGLGNITEATAMAKYRAFNEPTCPWE